MKKNFAILLFILSMFYCPIYGQQEHMTENTRERRDNLFNRGVNFVKESRVGQFVGEKVGGIINYTARPVAFIKEIDSELRQKYSIDNKYETYRELEGGTILISNDNREGYYIYTNGSYYKGGLGTCSRNMINRIGYGVFYDRNGNKVFEGIWDEGQYGRGTFYHKDYECSAEEFDREERCPNGKINYYRWTTGMFRGSEFKGYFKDCKPFGCGRLEVIVNETGSGHSYSSSYGEDIIFDINMNMFDKGGIYIGEFDDKSFNGIGIFNDYDLSKYLMGNWTNAYNTKSLRNQDKLDFLDKIIKTCPDYRDELLQWKEDIEQTIDTTPYNEENEKRKNAEAKAHQIAESIKMEQTDSLVPFQLQDTILSNVSKDERGNPMAEVTYTVNLEPTLVDTIVNGVITHKLIKDSVLYSKAEYQVQSSEGVTRLVNRFNDVVTNELCHLIDESSTVEIRILSTTDAIPFSPQTKVPNVFTGFKNYDYQVLLNKEDVEGYLDSAATKYGRDLNIDRYITNNKQLAFLRTVGIRQFIEANIGCEEIKNRAAIESVYADTSKTLTHRHRDNIFDHYIYNYTHPADTGEHLRIASIELSIINPNIKSDEDYPIYYTPYDITSEFKYPDNNINRGVDSYALIICNYDYRCDTVIRLRHQKALERQYQNKELIYLLSKNRLGYQNIDTLVNANLNEMEGAITRFNRKIDSNNERKVDLFIYYTGYARWYEDGMYFFPKGFEWTKPHSIFKGDDVDKLSLYKFSHFLDDLVGHKNINQIAIIIDGAFEAENEFDNTFPIDFKKLDDLNRKLDNKVVLISANETSLNYKNHTEITKFLADFFTGESDDRHPRSIVDYIYKNMALQKGKEEKMYDDKGIDDEDEDEGEDDDDDKEEEQQEQKHYEKHIIIYPHPNELNRDFKF